jgi:hypothetical protein
MSLWRDNRHKQLLARPTFFLLGLGGLKKEAGASPFKA